MLFAGERTPIGIYYLALEAGVKFTPYYNITTVDPPELICFIRKKFPDVILITQAVWTSSKCGAFTTSPKETMWRLIVRHKILPTRIIRYFCADLKEATFMLFRKEVRTRDRRTDGQTITGMDGM